MKKQHKITRYSGLKQESKTFFKKKYIVGLFPSEFPIVWILFERDDYSRGWHLFEVFW